MIIIVTKKKGLIDSLPKSIVEGNAFSIVRGKKIHWFKWDFGLKKWVKYKEVGRSDTPQEVTIKIYKNLPRFGKKEKK